MLGVLSAINDKNRHAVRGDILRFRHFVAGAKGPSDE